MLGTQEGGVEAEKEVSGLGEVETGEVAGERQRCWGQGQESCRGRKRELSGWSEWCRGRHREMSGSSHSGCQLLRAVLLSAVLAVSVS